MNFQPKSEEDLRKDFAPIPRGTYDFEVLNAIDKISSNGNDMIEVSLAIWSGEKILCRVFDYLLPAMEAKLRHACDACGLLNKYQMGVITAADFMGRTGKVKIKIKPADDTYKAKNEVEDYVCRPAKALGKSTPSAASDEPPPISDADLPF